MKKIQHKNSDDSKHKLILLPGNLGSTTFFTKNLTLTKENNINCYICTDSSTPVKWVV